MWFYLFVDWDMKNINNWSDFSFYEEFLFKKQVYSNYLFMEKFMEFFKVVHFSFLEFTYLTLYICRVWLFASVLHLYFTLTFDVSQR